MTSDSRAGIVLPPDWARVPLLDAGARATAVRDIVARQTAGAPVAPNLRRELERVLRNLTDDAARAGGQLMAFSTQIAHGRPLPISLSVFRPELPRTMADVVETLDGEGTTEVAQGPSGTTVRHITQQASSLANSPEIDQFTVAYWLDPHDGHGLFHAVFTSPLSGFEDELCALFDTMVATVARAEDIAFTDDPEPH